MTAWTVRTWDSKLNFSHVYVDDMDHKYTVQASPRTPIAAIPNMESIMDHKFTDKVTQLCLDLQEDHLSTSFVAQAAVYNVPEKAAIDEEDVDLCRFIAENDNDTGSRWPMGLFEEPVASNIGLLQIMKRFGEVSEITTTAKYSQLLVDVNLFWRILKILNNVPSLSKYRQNIFLSLGTYFLIFPTKIV